MALSETKPIRDHNFSLNGNQLKILASAAMFADHAVKAWRVPGLTYILCAQVFGRIAFPIYCFMITEGFFHTRNRWKYLLRVLLFAFLSELQYDYVLHHRLWYPRNQNVLFILACGLLMFMCLSWVESYRNMRIEVSCILRLLLVAGFAAAAHYLCLDYKERGILCMAILYFLRDVRPRSVSVLWSCLPLNLNHFSNPGSFLSAIPLHFYNGERGTARLKYFFYFFYPVHLLVILLIQQILL